ncbi:hypothetical protein ES332_D10G064300v1 [Gossypium tomentosum]|uniref:TF-B3 domain-containing protein n=1 Tax=Gossypium tomentosum TaxID=34277 RepID=A0A5D2J1G7_GOSTO|nr:hypothetical protein ES332_D10G064300v1 [Gossypium tomentosum]
MENQEQGKQSFSKHLTQSEVKDRIIFFSYTDVAPFFDLGKAWTFIGTFYANPEVGKYVSIKWPQFSSEKGLKANDEVIFTEKPQREGEAPWKKFNVVIKRKIRLFGQDIWGELKV